MVNLQMLERYDTFAEFDPASGVLKEFKRKTFGRKPPANPHGVYSQLRGSFLAFYGLDGKFFLAFGTRVVEIGVDETIEVSGPRSARVLRVLDGRGDVVAEVNYCLDGIRAPVRNDPTPFVEDEDRDIGLLASNISKSAKRRAVLADPSGPI